MSDMEASKSKASVGWTDRQRLAYFFSLVDFSKVKLDYANAPRPEGKSVGACQIMMHRLRGTLKDDLEALRNGTAMPEDAPKKTAGTPKSTPRKRKAKGDAEGEGEATPTKNGRNKKAAVAEEEPAAANEDEEKAKVKTENVDEEVNVGDD